MWKDEMTILPLIAICRVRPYNLCAERGTHTHTPRFHSSLSSCQWTPPPSSHEHPSPPRLLPPPPPPPSSPSPVATALLPRPRPPSSSVRAQPPPPTSPEHAMAVPCLRRTTTGHSSLPAPPSSLVVGRNPRSLPIELAKSKAPGSSSSCRGMESRPRRDEEEEEQEEEISYWKMMVGMYKDFRRRAPLRRAARAAPRRLPAARISAPQHTSHRGNAGDKGMVAPPKRPPSARTPSFSRRKESQRGLGTGNKFQPLACMTEEMVDLVLSPHPKELAVRERIERGKGGEAFSVEASEDYNGSASDRSDEDACSSVGTILIGEIEVKFNLDQYKWPELESTQGKANEAPLPVLATSHDKESMASPLPALDTGKEAKHMVAPLPALDTGKEAKHIAAPLPALDSSKEVKHIAAPLPALDSSKEVKHMAAPLPALDSSKEVKHMAAPLPALDEATPVAQPLRVVDTDHRQEATPVAAMLKAYAMTQVGQSTAAGEPARNPLAVDIGPVPAAGGGGGLGRGGGGGGPGGGGAPGGGGGGGGGPGGGLGGGGGGGPGGGGGDGGGGPGGGGDGHGNVPGLRVLPNELPHALCHCRDPATRYCRGCHQIYCPFCFCNCNAVNYFLPLPSLVGGSCVLNQPVTLTDALYPMVFVGGVRQEPWLYWQFATADDIFQVEDVQPTIDLLVYGFRMQRQWVVQMPQPVHVDVLRAAVFPAHYP
ncbi:uncharacterized protein LOC125506678 [Triticum urartu]|uniref:uncharacterized protein LOC125506678 n=1 Tax=Triticum urartu TaxID=4572 RepID=UPI0020439427|nr:uncharacterized protein LOC125506678 [Triticum urartu]